MSERDPSAEHPPGYQSAADTYTNLISSSGEDASGRKYAYPEDQVSGVWLDFSRMFFMLYSNLDVQIQIADNKAHLVMAANTILLTGLALNSSSAETIFNDLSNPLAILALLSTLAMVGMIFGSLYYALMVARPRLIPASEQDNLFFFGDISNLQREEFVQRFMGQNMTEIKAAVLQQVHARSKVVMRKYADSRRSINFLVAAIVFWVLTSALYTAL